MRGFFVAGTDTSVGKTEVARVLLALLRPAVPLKPVETGCAPEHPGDALALLQASGGSFELDRVCPYRFRLPAAPLVAAEAEGKTISIERIEQLVARAAPMPIVVEAAGGLLVPLAREVAALTLEQADPAERAPARFAGRSSTKRQRSGCSPSSSAVRRKTSGSGFISPNCADSTTQSKAATRG